MICLILCIFIKLDVLTSSYREEELSTFLSLSKKEKGIVIGLKKFNSYINNKLIAYFNAGAFVTKNVADNNAQRLSLQLEYNFI